MKTKNHYRGCYSVFVGSTTLLPIASLPPAFQPPITQDLDIPGQLHAYPEKKYTSIYILDEGCPTIVLCMDVSLATQRRAT